MTHRHRHAALVVLAKAPVPGRVKTRLTPPLTARQAAELAAAALLDTLDTVAAAAGSAGAVVALAGDPAAGVRAAEVQASLRRFLVVPQCGGGLDERIAAAHLDAATQSGARSTLQIGMDTPGLVPDDLRSASARLGEPDVDAVLGPAADGGWWALGLTEPATARLLLGVPTSWHSTGQLTYDRLLAGGVRTALLEYHRDVDTWPDAALTADAYPGGRFAAAVRACAAGTVEASAS